MDNNDFINLYIEKILTKLSDTERKFLLLETQFDFNKKAWEDNFKELEEKTKMLKEKTIECDDVRQELSTKVSNLDISEEAQKILKSDVTRLYEALSNKERELLDIKSSYEDIIKTKNSDMHVLTLQIEDLKKILLEKDKLVEEGLKKSSVKKAK